MNKRNSMWPDVARLTLTEDGNGGYDLSGQIAMDRKELAALLHGVATDIARGEATLTPVKEEA